MSAELAAQLAAAALSGSALPACGKYLARLITGGAQRESSRVSSLEDLVDALRRALDKGRLREDALAQVLGVLIFALKSIEEISPAIGDALERAIDILEGAQSHLQRLSESDPE